MSERGLLSLSLTLLTLNVCIFVCTAINGACQNFSAAQVRVLIGKVFRKPQHMLGKLEIVKLKGIHQHCCGDHSFFYIGSGSGSEIIRDLPKQ